MKKKIIALIAALLVIVAGAGIASQTDLLANIQDSLSPTRGRVAHAWDDWGGGQTTGGGGNTFESDITMAESEQPIVMTTSQNSTRKTEQSNENDKPWWEQPEVPSDQQGKLVFFQHGLEDRVSCFQIAVNELCANKKKYIDLGYITVRNLERNPEYGINLGSEYLQIFQHEYPDESKNYGRLPLKIEQYHFPELIEKLSKIGIHVLVRTEFSAGNLSFDTQKTQLSNMVSVFNGQGADVVFIGHSMGGLASINYAVDYAGKHIDKKVQIVTVDTPYQPNWYAAEVWWDKTGTSAKAAGQVRGYAHRDLGGDGDALASIRQKWNDNTLKNIRVSAISVSMYSTKDEKGWNKIGDGIVDIPAQQGNALNKNDVKWDNINVQPVISGTGVSPNTEAAKMGQAGNVPLQDAINTEHPYHHINTPQRDEVIKLIDKCINQLGGGASR